MISKIDTMGGVDEPSRDFKKNRNLSTTTNSNQSVPLSINLPNTKAFNSQNQSPILNSPTLPNVQTIPSAHSINNLHMLQPTNNKINGQSYPETPKSPSFQRVGDEHKLVIEGVRLSM